MNDSKSNLRDAGRLAAANLGPVAPTVYARIAEMIRTPINAAAAADNQRAA
jgi:hypothetical protein